MAKNLPSSTIIQHILVHLVHKEMTYRMPYQTSRITFISYSRLTGHWPLQPSASSCAVTLLAVPFQFHSHSLLTLLASQMPAFPWALSSTHCSCYVLRADVTSSTPMASITPDVLMAPKLSLGYTSMLLTVSGRALFGCPLGILNSGCRQ